MRLIGNRAQLTHRLSGTRLLSPESSARSLPAQKGLLTRQSIQDQDRHDGGALSDLPGTTGLPARGHGSGQVRQQTKTAQTVRFAPFVHLELVGGTRIELVTPSMSTKCSTAELTARSRRSGRASDELYGRDARPTTGLSNAALLRRVPRRPAVLFPVTDGSGHAAGPHSQIPGFARVYTSAPPVS